MKSIWKPEPSTVPEDVAKCQEWIRDYIAPAEKINHLYTSKLLVQMMREDTHTEISHLQFKELMAKAGYEPSEFFREVWEFRISSAPLRRRPSAKAKGWMSHRTRYQMNRMR